MKKYGLEIDQQMYVALFHACSVNGKKELGLDKALTLLANIRKSEAELNSIVYSVSKDTSSL